ncbi:FAD-binding protein [Variovorax guangxiensis]|uniref:FAD-dependent oxidoreductase n=1 Tax=Variovorax guangxiensis TaxID=1775474 RepID=UPI0028576233|nr:FAD-binding protein [Variovorax guangxiensis]MDR6860914.1 fumarate reductase flavoprotein subunit [Variovorax guangxiensis]
MHCDLVVIGAGVSGLVAALRAAQGGRRVLVLEKLIEERYVCNSRLTTGVWHCCAMDLRSEAAKLEARIMEVTGNWARPDLARAVATDGVRSVRWMQKAGVRFMKGPFDYQSFVLSPPALTAQGRQWEGRGGDVMLRTLEVELAKLGGRVLRGHRAMRLDSEGGTIRGLSGEAAAGAPFSVQANAVVIADGGFQANTQLLRGAGTPRPEAIFQRNAGTGMGDGLSMARDAGAQITDLRGFYGHVLSSDAFNNDQLSPYPYLDHVIGAGLIIDRNGRRFTDEGCGGVAVANAMGAGEDPSGTIVIADSRIWNESGTQRLLSPNPTLANNGGTLHQANSIAELAALCGLDRASLVATIDTYNTALKAGKGLELSPPRSAGKQKPMPIETAPFYAMPACAGITYTMGGIAIDAASRALAADGSPMTGLYAVGCATGGLEGGEKCGYVGGLVKSSVTALRAAEHFLGELAQ